MPLLKLAAIYLSKSGTLSRNDNLDSVLSVSWSSVMATAPMYEAVDQVRLYLDQLRMYVPKSS